MSKSKILLRTRILNWLTGGRYYAKLNFPKGTLVKEVVTKGKDSITRTLTFAYDTGKVVGTKVLTWGRVAKASIVAVGGVLGYYLYKGGLVDFVSNLLKVDENTSKIVIIVAGIVVLIIVVRWVLGKVGRRAPTHRTYRPYKRYNGANKKGGRY